MEEMESMLRKRKLEDEMERMRAIKQPRMDRLVEVSY